MDNSEAVPRLHRLRTYLPAVFFLAGFGWDAITLGSRIKSVDLWILLGYYLAAVTILLLIGRGIEFRYSQYLKMALQFFFGGIFSALVIFYFLSSSELPGHILVVLMVVLLIANELMEKRYDDLTIAWTFFCFAGIMLFNFSLPHLFRSIDSRWFYLSTAAGFAAVLFLRLLSKRVTARVWPAAATTATLLLLHLFNLIPPVPLVKRQMVIGHDMRKADSGYVGWIEPAPSWKFWRPIADNFHRRDGEKVYAFTSVFLPEGIHTVIRHQWDIYDRAAHRWHTMSTIPFTVSGGRQGGYRGFTWKENVQAGRWRVRAISEHGRTIGVIQFDMMPAQGSSGIKRRQVKL